MNGQDGQDLCGWKGLGFWERDEGHGWAVRGHGDLCFRSITLHLYTHVHRTIFTVAQRCDSPSVIDRGVDKHKAAHSHEGMLLSLRKEGIPVACYNVDGPGGQEAQ